MIYDLRRFNGSFKGTIGECMFKITNDKVVITKIFNKWKYFTIFRKYFTTDQEKFLKENWYSIDAIEIDYTRENKRIILYEVKTKNTYANLRKWPHKVTQSTVDIYRKSTEIGFIAKMVTVWFHPDWNY